MVESNIQQSFGGAWTTAKLNAVENYIKAYFDVMKNTTFKLCYIDTFAGSGSILLKNGEIVDGSTIRALKFPFDKYFFFEENKEYSMKLEKRLKNYPNKDVTLISEDCNIALKTINSKEWKRDNWRGIVFIDPCAMDLSWDSLKQIADTQVFDVWYLFPLMAVNRNLYKRVENIPEANRNTLTHILGSNDWETELYKESSQLTFNLFKNDNLEKQGTDAIKEYIVKRLKSIFPTVAENAVVMRNEKNAPVFLLCFAGSNPSPKAKEISLRVANHILNKI